MDQIKLRHLKQFEQQKGGCSDPIQTWNRSFFRPDFLPTKKVGSCVIHTLNIGFDSRAMGSLTPPVFQMTQVGKNDQVFWNRITPAKKMSNGFGGHHCSVFHRSVFHPIFHKLNAHALHKPARFPVDHCTYSNVCLKHLLQMTGHDVRCSVGTLFVFVSSSTDVVCGVRIYDRLIRCPDFLASYLNFSAHQKHIFRVCASCVLHEYT